jgi:hypothetical protein
MGNVLLVEILGAFIWVMSALMALVAVSRASRRWASYKRFWELALLAAMWAATIFLSVEAVKIVADLVRPWVARSLGL